METPPRPLADPILVTLNLGHSVHIADPAKPELWPLCLPLRHSSELAGYDPFPPSLRCHVAAPAITEATCPECTMIWREMMVSLPPPAVVTESPAYRFTYVGYFPYNSYGESESVYECPECFALVQSWSRESHLKAVHPDKPEVSDG